jgi:hypothetical protein
VAVLRRAWSASRLWAGRYLLGVLAVTLLAFGAWMAWHPAGPMVAGLILLADRVEDRVSAMRRAGGSR